MSNEYLAYNTKTVREWVAFKRQYDIQWQSVNNGAARVSKRRRGVNQNEFWIGIQIPAGRKLIVFEDTITLTENDYDVDIFRAPDGFTVADADADRATKVCLCDNGVQSVTSEFFVGVTPSNPATHKLVFQDYIDQGSIQGPGRPTAAPLSQNAFQILREHTLIRITRQSGGGSYTAAYRALVWEDGA